MPMMPMLPAKLVRNVRPFLVIRLFSESESAVRPDIERFLGLVFFAGRDSVVASASTLSTDASATLSSGIFSAVGASSGS